MCGVAGLTGTVYGRLQDSGFFFDPVQREVEQQVIPWLRGETEKIVARHMTARYACTRHKFVARHTNARYACIYCKIVAWPITARYANAVLTIYAALQGTTAKDMQKPDVVLTA